MLARGASATVQSPTSDPAKNVDFADMSALGGPRFILTVDTEEEFDWNKPFARDGFGTSHLRAVPRFQELCAKYGVTPCYLVDFPIAEDSFGVELLGGYAKAGMAEIGVQLHPWVNPPFDESLSLHNSYACNLPEALERAKLTKLHEAIVSRFGVKPDAYRAGRYGAGANTAAILDDLGIAIDSSVRSRFDYSDQGGPDYTYRPLAPYWLRRGSVLELPLTTVFAGALRTAGPVMFGEMFASQTARSVLARSKMLERIALTPEGIPLAKALEGIDLALEKAVPIINLSFHSPSLAIGHTPYVQDARQLELLFEWFHGAFSHLKASGVRPTCMAEIKQAALFPGSA
jgi:hypothetical protein